MGDDLGVGLGHEFRAAPGKLGAQLVEVLDDAVVHDGDAIGRVRMRIGLVRSAVGRPAGMADADRAEQRLALEPLLEIPELALGTPSGQMAVLERGDARGIIAAIFEPPQRIDQPRRDRLQSQDSDNSAHEA